MPNHLLGLGVYVVDLLCLVGSTISGKVGSCGIGKTMFGGTIGA